MALSILHGTFVETSAAQKTQRDYKTKISSQSKKNFVLEKDVRYLDSRIALLVQNRMALEEVRRSYDTGNGDWLTGLVS